MPDPCHPISYCWGSCGVYKYLDETMFCYLCQNWFDKIHRCTSCFFYLHVLNVCQTGTRPLTVHPARTNRADLVWSCRLPFSTFARSTSRWLVWERLLLLWCHQSTLHFSPPPPSWAETSSRTSSTKRWHYRRPLITLWHHSIVFVLLDGILNQHWVNMYLQIKKLHITYTTFSNKRAYEKTQYFHNSP